MPRQSWAVTLAELDQLLAAVEANQKDFPYVEASRVQLEARVKDLRSLHARRASLQAEAIQATKALAAHLALGRDLAIRIRSTIRGRYGYRSKKLVQFGVKPIRRRKPAKGKSGSGRRKKRGSPESHRTVK